MIFTKIILRSCTLSFLLAQTGFNLHSNNPDHFNKTLIRNYFVLKKL